MRENLHGSKMKRLQLMKIKSITKNIVISKLKIVNTPNNFSIGKRMLKYATRNMQETLYKILCARIMGLMRVSCWILRWFKREISIFTMMDIFSVRYELF